MLREQAVDLRRNNRGGAASTPGAAPLPYGNGITTPLRIPATPGRTRRPSVPWGPAGQVVRQDPQDRPGFQSRAMDPCGHGSLLSSADSALLRAARSVSPPASSPKDVSMVKTAVPAKNCRVLSRPGSFSACSRSHPRKRRLFLCERVDPLCSDRAQLDGRRARAHVTGALGTAPREVSVPGEAWER